MTTVPHLHDKSIVTFQNRRRPSLALSSPKLSIHCGNLSAELLGLEPSIFSSIAQTVDLVIHCGANRSLWDAYPALRSANVIGTKTLIALASHNRAPVHFLSSGTVTDVPDGAVPPTDGSNGYVASKWASERLLENAAAQLGVPAIFHRPTKAADLHPPSEALLGELKSLVERMRCVPISGGWNGTFVIMPVTVMAESVVATALESSSEGGKQGISIEEHVGMIKLEMSDVLKVTQEGQNSPLKALINYQP